MNFAFNYILFDAARIQLQLGEAKAFHSKYSSLYEGRSEEDLADVAPYVFTIPNDPDFVMWYFEKGWGDAWGLLVQSPFAFEVVFKHFQNFLLVKTENGEELYFRFYDPRVLRIFLPTCDSRQLKEFFGPVEHFIVESESKKEAIRFWHENGILKQQILPVEQIFGKILTTSIDNH